jgi:hypothetical protein
VPLICPTAKAEYFRQGGLDRANHLDAVQQFSPLAQTLISPTSPQSKIVATFPLSLRCIRARLLIFSTRIPSGFKVHQR